MRGMALSKVLFPVFMILVMRAPAWAAAPTGIELFSPEGAVREVRQATARFSAPMVPFGDLRAPAPIEVDCPVPGKGRWVDERTWAYDFERDLPGALRCRFQLRAEVRDLAGQPLAGRREFVLTTGGPAVLHSQPYDGSSSIDERQGFVLALSAAATPQSLAAHAWCEADGVAEKIGVRILSGEAREQALLASRWMVQSTLRGDGDGDRERAPNTPYTVARLRADQGAGKLDRFVVLQCQRTLPADTKIALVWGAGVAAANGVATTEDQRLAYQTRPDFSARLRCERVNARSQCIPFLPMRLEFSAPVAAADARAIYVEEAGGKRHPAAVGKEEGSGNAVSVVNLPGPFPENARLTLHIPDGLKDDAGRPLVNQARFPLAVRTGEAPPLVKFAAGFGILEAKGDRMLPVTVRNVEPALAGAMRSSGTALKLQAGREQDVQAWLRKLASTGWGSTPGQPSAKQLESSVFAREDAASLQRFTLPKPNGRRAFEVIGIPLREPGFYVVELESPRLGAALNPKGRKAFVRSSVLVTNMAAHVKLGAQSSLVWVTSLDKARPVGGARVEVRDCGARLLWSGSTDAQGMARIRKELPPSNCKGSGSQAYFVTARNGGDFTFTLSDWHEGIENWRFNLPTGGRFEDSRIAATVFDRSLLRAGETVHMKHFLRRHTQAGFALVKASDKPPVEGQDWRAQEVETDKRAIPARGFIVHQGTGEKTEFALDWDAGGAAQGEWKIPQDAKLGVYEVLVGGQASGSFRVEQFRVPTMKALLKGPDQAQVAPAAVAFDAQVSYLAGGPAALAPVKLRSVVQDEGVQFPDYEDFSLGLGDVKEGVVAQGGGGEEDEEGMESGEEGAEGGTQLEAARTQSLNLDRAGGARIQVDKLPAFDKPKSLLAELSFQDPNGETGTVAARVPLWPAAYVIGLKPEGWLQSREAVKFKAVVLDVAGKPVAGAPVSVDFFVRRTISHRRRLVGGFYAYEHSSEIKRLGEACSGVTDDHGLLACAPPAPAEGDLILRARASDPQGRLAATQREIWVAGSERQWFAAGDHDRIDLLPAKKRYEPGETAALQLRSPFRNATVLVTVEREGILDSYVRQVSGKDQVLRIPIKASYAPNVFVSALAVRGRVAGVQPTALVDLGKPAYKLGIAPLRVGWGAHELKVQVTAERPVYKVREQAVVAVKVAAPDGVKLPAGTEVAVAAVDAGLLELMPNTSWNLLETMMRERHLQVETATAQMQVIGKRHFGRKAFPHGGGGGRSATRELFETLLLWKGKVALDANGEARVQVPLNDTLGSFRIVAVASGGAGLFGSGATDVRTTQDLMLLSGLPATVREGDAFRAGFTVRNASQRELALRLGASVSVDGTAGKTLAPLSLTLAPGEARELGWTYQAPAGAKFLQWEVEADAGEGARDRIRIRQQVGSAVPVRTLQATLVQLDGEVTLPVQRPADALPGRGGIQTVLSPRLAGELPGVRDYMSAYPYTCFEQRTSRAVALHDQAVWEATAASLPAHLDGDGLVKYFATMEQGSDVLTAYVLAITGEAGYAIPEDLKQRMQAGLTAFVEGKVVRGNMLASGELTVRKLAALEALSRDGMVKPAMLESIAVRPNLWPTSAILDWYQVLLRTPELPHREQRLAEARQILRARLNLQGTKLGFSTERSDGWWWLMASADVNANRLLRAAVDDPYWRADIGRLARGALGRQLRGRWQTTTANAWGVVAMDAFSRAFESEPVSGKTSVVLGAMSWTGTAPATVNQAWPEGQAALKLRQLGSGKPWATVRSLAAVPLTAPLSSGYRIARSVTPVEQKTKGQWSRGDIYRVQLSIEAQADMTWVVVDDPIPAGATILGSGLGRDSQIATAGERSRGWVWPAFQERTQAAFRSYYEFVPKGSFSVEYTVRLNNEGRFALPVTRVEAMYDPEMFGELPNAGVMVGP